MSVYRKHCESCHGAHGDGQGEKASVLSIAPTDFTASPSMNQVTDGELFWKISEGRRPMPGFKHQLSEEERWQVVDYVHTLRQKPAARPSAQP
jgi:mono/diheme cytochrome c family protein